MAFSISLDSYPLPLKDMLMDAESNPKIVIIGGGVAGLCAAIELCMQGILPVVIEAGNYPSHKVCGEFLSPECLPWLKNLNIDVVPILDAHFHCGSRVHRFTFPSAAGSLSHSTFDPALVQCAIDLGAQIHTQVKVVDFHPKQKRHEKHRLELSTGQILKTPSIIIATGRLPSLCPSSTEIKYLGIKAHFEGIDSSQSLQMFGFKSAYLGLSPIEGGKTNLACLAAMERVKRAGSVEQLMTDLISENCHLQSMLKTGKRLFEQWMTAPIPFFGFKPTPDWLDAYFIGDAALSIPPACGGGLSLAITSGIMAARYAMANDYLVFKTIFKQQCTTPMRAAKGLHYLFMHPFLGKLVMRGCTLCSPLARKLYQSSRPYNLNQSHINHPSS